MAINIAGNTVINDSGRFFLPSMLNEPKVAMGANNIDLAAGAAFTKTISGSTTFTVSNVPASGKVGSFILEIITTVASPAITWWAGVKWAGGTAPTLPNINTVNSFAFYTHDGGTTWNGMLIGKNFFLAPIGEQLYTTPGSYTWVCPASVTSVCVVCIGAGGGGYDFTNNTGGGGGGGGLGYKNSIVVVPGNSYNVSIGAAGLDGGGISQFGDGSAVYGGGGAPASWATGGLGGAGGTFLGDGGGAGGTGGEENYGFRSAGGGGAGGYSGAGGHGGNSGSLPSLMTAGLGGAGGGGYGGDGSGGGYGGGGVGLYGQGSSGAEGTEVSKGGKGGSGGTNGLLQNDPGGGLYGGGSPGTSDTGGKGAVRIIWGPGRSFPHNAA